MAELLRFSEHLIHDGFTYALAAADLTGGESPDLVVTDINVGIHLFENDGRGGFTHHLVHRRVMSSPISTATVSQRSSRWTTSTAVSSVSNTTAIRETRAVCIADFDGNGTLDLLGTVCAGNQVVWYENCGTSSGLKWKKHIIDETTRPYHGHPADMDGDGDTDVVMALRGDQDSDRDGSIVWYENEESTGTTWRKHLIAGFPGAFEAVAGDLDGDGEQEVVASSIGTGQLALFKHEGDPRGPWQMQLLKEDWQGIARPILADLDGDGRLDLAVCSAHTGDGVRWWKNEGPA